MLALPKSRISGREVSSWIVGISSRILGVWGHTKHRAATESIQEPLRPSCALPCHRALRRARAVLPHHPGPGLRALSVRYPFMPVAVCS